MTKSKIFLYFCLAFIGGIFIGSKYFEAQLLVIGFLILGIFLISVFWNYKKLVVIGFCFLFLAVGNWRYHTAMFKIENSELKQINNSSQKITLIGIVSAEPDFRERIQRLTIKPKTLKIAQNYITLYSSGRVLVVTGRYPEYRYGDQLKIIGRLKEPGEFKDFNYKNYLLKEGIYSVMYWPEIKLLERNCRNCQSGASAIYKKILEFKSGLRETIYQNLSPPHSSILTAMILGDKRKMSEDLKEKLNITGVRHITAISGMHIMVISGILMYLGIAIGLWRGQAFYFALALLTLFIIMVGLPPSAIRAGIMGGFFLLAQKIGRPRAAGPAIVFAATTMLAVNPLLLGFDIGFQLSFLAAIGIIYLMPSFKNWLKKIPDPEIFPLRSFFSITLAAQVFTLPILIYNFGYISLVSLVTNILIMSLIPFIMTLGFAFSLIGMIFQPLGWVLSWPTWLLLTYVIKIIDLTSRTPLASVAIQNFHWLWLLLAYLILGIITWRLNVNRKPIFLNY